MISHYPILILDDEKDICFLLGTFLKQHFNIVESINSIKELEAVDLTKYKIIFIDNNLLDGNGFDKIPDIIAQNNSIKVIAISAFDTATERDTAIEKGANLFLGKPFSREDIITVINKMKELSHEV